MGGGGGVLGFGVGVGCEGWDGGGCGGYFGGGDGGDDIESGDGEVLGGKLFYS